MVDLELRNDVYRRPLATALDRLGIGAGWRCADIGAGGGDVTVALAHIVGAAGRVYAVDRDPARRNEVARAAAEAAQAQVVAVTQAGEELNLPEPLDLVYGRFLLLHVHDPLVVVVRMGTAARPGSWVVIQEPITSAGRIDGKPFTYPDAEHPMWGPSSRPLPSAPAWTLSTHGPRRPPAPGRAPSPTISRL